MKNITNEVEIKKLFQEFKPSSDGAYATGRSLPGLFEQENQQEWAERGRINGAPATVYYIFSKNFVDRVIRIEIADKKTN